jgi:hypothetical protein
MTTGGPEQGHKEREVRIAVPKFGIPSKAVAGPESLPDSPPEPLTHRSHRATINPVLWRD